jgi:hypothetical protein
MSPENRTATSTLIERLEAERYFSLPRHDIEDRLWRAMQTRARYIDSLADHYPIRPLEGAVYSSTGQRHLTKQESGDLEAFKQICDAWLAPINREIAAYQAALSHSLEIVTSP